jgi:DNA-binding NtrC family response regulator
MTRTSPSSPSADTPSGYPCTVLIVDADAESAAAATALLEAEDHLVFPVGSLATAIHLLDVMVVGVILVDPFTTTEADSSGFLSVPQQANGVPVVLFTAHPVDAEAALAAGFAAVVQKPYDAESLITAVREGARRAADYWAPPRRAPRGVHLPSSP